MFAADRLIHISNGVLADVPECDPMPQAEDKLNVTEKDCRSFVYRLYIGLQSYYCYRPHCIESSGFGSFTKECYK